MALEHGPGDPERDRQDVVAREGVALPAEKRGVSGIREPRGPIEEFGRAVEEERVVGHAREKLQAVAGPEVVDILERRDRSLTRR